MKYFCTFFLASLALFFAQASNVQAHVPVIVGDINQRDIITIDDPTLSQAFYGDLNGFPHTFQIVAKEPFQLFTHILVPDIDSSTNNISGIIIKERAGGGRVIEVTRLMAKDGTWNAEYEPFGGDSYREGPQFDTMLEAGVYRVEVHTPDNEEKYVLVVGKREEMTIGYFELLRRLVQVKTFFEKPKIFVVQSPFVYVPLFLLCAVAFYWYFRRHGKYQKSKYTS